MPRAAQHPPPVSLGVGRTPASAERAAGVRLPMFLGYIVGGIGQLRRLAVV